MSRANNPATACDGARSPRDGVERARSSAKHRDEILPATGRTGEMKYEVGRGPDAGT